MVFKTSGELEKFLLGKCKIALTIAQEKVYEIIDNCLNRFYGEYTPAEYIRTKQLLYSLVLGDVKKVGNEFIAEVYFDASRIHYSDVAAGKSGQLHKKERSDEEIFENAMTGAYPHGWWEKAGGTGIWTESSKHFNDMFNILKKELIAQGIPIR